MYTGGFITPEVGRVIQLQNMGRVESDFLWVGLNRVVLSYKFDARPTLI